MKDIVSFKQAELLDYLEYTGETNYYYQLDSYSSKSRLIKNNVKNNWNGCAKDKISAPTIKQAYKFLNSIKNKKLLLKQMDDNKIEAALFAINEKAMKASESFHISKTDLDEKFHKGQYQAYSECYTLLKNIINEK